jgi:hypothetical protein
MVFLGDGSLDRQKNRHRVQNKRAEPSKQFSTAVSELWVSLVKAADQFSLVLRCGNE